MRQVVGPIRPVWVKGSFNFKNGANWRKQTHISDIRQNNAKYNFYGSCEGSSTR